MASGNAILVTGEPKGVYLDGIVSGALKPGTCVELTSTAAVGGRFTYQAYQPGTDGEQRPVIVLLENLEGGTASTAYVSGDRGRFYCPLPGEEVNVLAKNIGGTATGSGDSFAIADLLTLDTGTGKVIATTGTPEMEPFQCLETVAEITADALVHCMCARN
tara:strand:+ start:58952 stop:59434 length:483 start_codon:yes stop_codon:yes gene_type:complete